MPSMINPELLKPHPKNREYYADLPPEKYAEVKRSIEAGGIRDPLWIMPDYTLIRGHQRLKIALELELDQVPVEIKDVSPEEAEYLIIADNEERRQDDNDDMRKARRAKFLADYWGVRLGKANPKGTTVPRQGQNALDDKKTLQDVAAAVGEGYDTTKRLLKLNDLIPELQSLVSSGKLGTTAAEQLAYLSGQTQRELYGAMGEAIGELTFKETKDLRARAGEAERLQKELENAQTRAAEAEHALREARGELADLKDNLAEAITDAKGEATHKEKDRVAKLEDKISGLELARKKDAARVKDLRDQLAGAKKQVSEATKEVDRELQKKLVEAVAEVKRLTQELEGARNPVSKSELDRQMKEKEQQIRHLDREIADRRTEEALLRQIRETMRVVGDMEVVMSKNVLIFHFPISKELLCHAETLRRVADNMAEMVSGNSRIIDLTSEDASFDEFKSEQ